MKPSSFSTNRFRLVIAVCWVLLPFLSPGQTGPGKVVIEGRIRQLGSGVPLEGRVGIHKVVVQADGKRGSVLDSIPTNSQGYYRLEIEPGLLQIDLLGRSEGHIPYKRTWGVVTANRTVNFELSPAVPFSGFLVDPAGRPVDEALVRIVYPDDEAMSGIGEIMGNVKTNALGRFDLPYVKAIGRFLVEESSN